MTKRRSSAAKVTVASLGCDRCRREQATHVGVWGDRLTKRLLCDHCAAVAIASDDPPISCVLLEAEQQRRDRAARARAKLARNNLRQLCQFPGASDWGIDNEPGGNP